MTRRLVAVALSFLLSAAGAAQMSKADGAKAIKDLRKLAETADKSLRAGNAAAVSDSAGQYTGSLESLSRALAAGAGDDADTVELAGELEQVAQSTRTALQAGAAAVAPEARPAVDRAIEASAAAEKSAAELVLKKGMLQENPTEVTDKYTRDVMERTDALLRYAERAGKRGDYQAVDRSVRAYAVNISVLGVAIQKGALNKKEALFVLDRIAGRTRAHTRTLEGILRGAPETAKPGIEQALLVSKRGNEVAGRALQKAQGGGPTPSVGNAPSAGGPASGNMPGQPGIPPLPQ